MPTQAVADFALPATGGADFNLYPIRSKSLVIFKGILRKEWRGLKADGHAQEVLDFVQTL